MNIDIKHNLFKKGLTEQAPGKKNINKTIDQSMVACAEQKNLGTDVLNESDKQKELKKKKKKEIELELERKKQEDKLVADSVNIVRDPLALLKLL